jgi:hypothetical protein
MLRFTTIPTLDSSSTRTQFFLSLDYRIDRINILYAMQLIQPSCTFLDKNKLIQTWIKIILKEHEEMRNYQH